MSGTWQTGAAIVVCRFERPKRKTSVGATEVLTKARHQSRLATEGVIAALTQRIVAAVAALIGRCRLRVGAAMDELRPQRAAVACRRDRRNPALVVAFN